MSNRGQPFASPLPQRAVMFPVLEPPSGVRVVRRTSPVQAGYRDNARPAPAAIEIRARSIGARGYLLIAVTVFWNSVLAMFLLRGNIPTFMLLHFLAGAFLVFFSAKQFRNGFVLSLGGEGITSKQRTNSGAHAERVSPSSVTDFFCEPGTIELGTVSSGSGHRPIVRNVHHVCAVHSDGRVTRLLVDLEKPEVAFFIAQLLARELGLPQAG